MGGVFSEGIDLKEERLIGVIIVGTGLPMVCVEQEILKEYFDETEEHGFDFAYQYPGMNKVLQAAGRVIRTSEDEGVLNISEVIFHIVSLLYAIIINGACLQIKYGMS